MSREYNLEKRLVEYACKNMEIVKRLPSTPEGKYVAKQLIRCGNSPAFNYGEAQAAESRKDFIHKMRVVLKEPKECRIALTITSKQNMIEPAEMLSNHLAETEELIAITAKSIITAEQNDKTRTTERVGGANKGNM